MQNVHKTQLVVSKSGTVAGHMVQLVPLSSVQFSSTCSDMFVCLLNMFSWVWFIHGSLQDVILQFWYKSNPTLLILGC